MRSESSFDTELRQLGYDHAVLALELGQIKYAYYARKFNPNQSRVPAGSPGGGQWDGGGGASTQSIGYRSQAFCDAQYQKDVFQCKMVGKRSCYAQAMTRLVACERGHTIPPLNY